MWQRVDHASGGRAVGHVLHTAQHLARLTGGIVNPRRKTDPFSDLQIEFPLSPSIRRNRISMDYQLSLLRSDEHLSKQFRDTKNDVLPSFSKRG